MSARSRSLTVWKTVSLSGVALIAVGVLAGYIDVATHFTFEFISDDFDCFMLAFLIGTVLTFVGFIGWSAQPEARGSGLKAALILVAPWMVLLLGSPVGGTNIHGPAALVMLLIVPATVLALVLAILAKAKRV